MLKSKEIVEKNIDIAIKKVNTSLIKIFLLAAMAGIFVSVSVAAKNAAVYDIRNDSVSRLLSGVVFPIGFILIVFLGGELFTGNNLMIMAVLDKKIKLKLMIRNSVVVYIGNYIGTLIGVILVNYSGLLDASNGALGGYFIKLGCIKANISPLKCLISGILCNLFVCCAILMATASKQALTRLFVSWFVIFAFAVTGFEHIVVNMYTMPAGIFAKNNLIYVKKAISEYNLSLTQINNLNVYWTLRNFIFVTIGNIVGGVCLVGGIMYLINKKKWVKKGGNK